MTGCRDTVLAGVARRVFTWFQTVLREVLIGANAGDVEGVWDAMYRHTAGLWAQGDCDDGD